MKCILRLKFAFAAVLCMVLSGCFTPRSFLDPSAPRLGYEDLQRTQQPLRLKLSAQFQRNGEHFARVDSMLKDNAERVLRGTGLVTPGTEATDGTIDVVVNNIADIGNAAAKGAGVGLTLGLAGTTVMDAYELTITIQAGGKTITRSAVKGAIYSAIGNTTLPAGIEPVAPNVAFERALEQMLLKALKDMQTSGELAGLHNALPLALACLRGDPAV